MTEHKGQHQECRPCGRYRQDLAFFEQVRKLAGMAAMAAEEAEQYAEDIHDPELKKQAERELEQI